MGSRKFGIWEIEQKVGEGTFGTVYRCKDPFLKKSIAVKELKSQYLKAGGAQSIADFFKEAELLAHFNHPAFTHIHLLNPDPPWIAMEFLEGETLEAFLRRKEQIPLATLVRLFGKVCDGLYHIHAEVEEKYRTIHRDLKPANLLLLPDGNVKIVDFGVAKANIGDPTMVGVIKGTPLYMSPDHLAGMVDARSDLWSLAVILFEMVNGYKPFPDPDPSLEWTYAKLRRFETQVLNQSCQPVRTTLPEFLLKPFSEFFQKAFQISKEKRFQNAREFKAALEVVLADSAKSADPASVLLPPLSEIDTLLLDGNELFDAGRYREARECFRRVVALDPESEEAQHWLLEIASRLWDEDARPVIERLETLERAVRAAGPAVEGPDADAARAEARRLRRLVDGREPIYEGCLEEVDRALDRIERAAAAHLAAERARIGKRIEEGLGNLRQRRETVPETEAAAIESALTSAGRKAAAADAAALLEIEREVDARRARIDELFRAARDRELGLLSGLFERLGVARAACGGELTPALSRRIVEILSKAEPLRESGSLDPIRRSADEARQLAAAASGEVLAVLEREAAAGRKRMEGDGTAAYAQRIQEALEAGRRAHSTSDLETLARSLEEVRRAVLAAEELESGALKRMRHAAARSAADLEILLAVESLRGPAAASTLERGRAARAALRGAVASADPARLRAALEGVSPLRDEIARGAAAIPTEVAAGALPRLRRELEEALPASLAASLGLQKLHAEALRACDAAIASGSGAERGAALAALRGLVDEARLRGGDGAEQTRRSVGLALNEARALLARHASSLEAPDLAAAQRSLQDLESRGEARTPAQAQELLARARALVADLTTRFEAAGEGEKGPSRAPGQTAKLDRASVLKAAGLEPSKGKLDTRGPESPVTAPAGPAVVSKSGPPAAAPPKTREPQPTKPEAAPRALKEPVKTKTPAVPTPGSAPVGAGPKLVPSAQKTSPVSSGAEAREPSETPPLPETRRREERPRRGEEPGRRARGPSVASTAEEGVRRGEAAPTEGRPSRGKALPIAIGGAVVLIAGVVGLLLLTTGRGGREEKTSSAGSSPRSAPGSGATAPALPEKQSGSTQPPAGGPAGYLAVDALPWGKVTAVAEAGGGSPRTLPGLACAETPCVLTVPPGQYRVTVSHASFGETTSGVVEVSASQVASVRVQLPGFDVDKMIEEMQ